MSVRLQVTIRVAGGEPGSRAREYLLSEVSALVDGVEIEDPDDDGQSYLLDVEDVGIVSA